MDECTNTTEIGDSRPIPYAGMAVFGKVHKLAYALASRLLPEERELAASLVLRIDPMAYIDLHRYMRYFSPPTGELGELPDWIDVHGLRVMPKYSVS